MPLEKIVTKIRGLSWWQILLSLVLPQVVVRAICGASNNDKVGIMTTPIFQQHKWHLAMMQLWLIRVNLPKHNKAKPAMMTSSNGNIFRVTAPLCGEFTGPRWIPHTKASDAELFSLIGFLNGWVNNRDAGDLRRHRAHYDVTVMVHNAYITRRFYEASRL